MINFSASISLWANSIRPDEGCWTNFCPGPVGPDSLTLRTGLQGFRAEPEAHIKVKKKIDPH